MAGIPLDPLPNHWTLLTEGDQHDYLIMRSQFHEAIAKSRRGERIDVFVQRLKTIRAFISREPSTQWKRAIVCGVMFLNSALAINIQQLRILMGKCKSSINGSLQQLGYISKPSTHEIDQEMTKMIPLLKDDHSEMKKWTIRYGEFPEGRAMSPAPDAEMPVVVTSVNMCTADDMKKVVKLAFPCPAKCRHKFYDILHSFPLQTDII